MEYGDGSKVDDNANCSELLNNGNGVFAYMSTSEDLTGMWSDRMDSYDYGDDHCYFMAPWIGPKPQNVGNVLQLALDNVASKCSNLEVFYNTPAVQLVSEGGKVTGVIAKNADGEVIDGLYCVGNLGGPFYGGNDYPFHQTGLSLGRCYTFGMLAGKHAASKA